MQPFAGAQRPVYNAVAEPNGGEPATLLNRVATRLLFNIGPPIQKNMITNPELSSRLAEQLKREQSVPLTVTMTCHVCDDALPQTQHIRYASEKGSSEIAEFHIVPDLDVAQQRKAQSISFSIRRNNVELDFLNVPVRIQTAPRETSKAHSFRCIPNLGPDDPSIDLVVELVRDFRSGL